MQQGGRRLQVGRSEKRHRNAVRRRGGTSFFRLHWRSAVAAAAIALAVALPWAGYEYATSSMTRQLAQIRVSSSDGSISEVRLPDGSRVWLNARSHIEYSQGFGISDRNVKLTGEACFDVSKNKELPFVVSTKSANLKVLGTRFTFRDYPEDQCVTVKLMRGHVDIASTKTRYHIDLAVLHLVIISYMGVGIASCNRANLIVLNQVVDQT